MEKERRKRIIFILICILAIIAILLSLRTCSKPQSEVKEPDEQEVITNDAEKGEKTEETDKTEDVSDTKVEEKETTNTVSNNQSQTAVSNNSEAKPSTITIRSGEYVGYSTNNFEDKTSDLGLNPYHDSNKDDYSSTIAKGSVVWHGSGEYVKEEKIRYGVSLGVKPTNNTASSNTNTNTQPSESVQETKPSENTVSEPKQEEKQADTTPVQESEPVEQPKSQENKPAETQPTQTVPEKKCREEQVLVKEAWTEEIQEEGWTEKVLVKEAWDETVTKTETIPTKVTAYECNNGAITTSEDELDAWIDIAADAEDFDDTKYCYSWHEIKIDGEPEYKTTTYTVHHDAEYKDVYHEGNKTTIYHDAEYTTKTICD